MNRLQLLRDPGHCIALGAGLGLIPVAPGTFGTLPAFLLAWLLRQGAAAIGQPIYAAWLLWLLLLPCGIWLAGRCAHALGSQDPAAVVCDEFLAYAGLLLVLPEQPVTLAWSFLLFRLFDATKPWPISWCDGHVHGGLGIMLDDLVAAVFAWGVYQGLAWLQLPGGP